MTVSVTGRKESSFFVQAPGRLLMTEQENCRTYEKKCNVESANTTVESAKTTLKNGVRKVTPGIIGITRRHNSSVTLWTFDDILPINPPGLSMTPRILPINSPGLLMTPRKRQSQK